MREYKQKFINHIINKTYINIVFYALNKLFEKSRLKLMKQNLRLNISLEKRENALRINISIEKRENAL